MFGKADTKALLLAKNSFYAFGQGHPLVEKIIDFDACYLELGNGISQRQKQYREYITEVIQDDFLKKIRAQLYQGIYGDDDFIQAMKEKFKMGSLRRVGRPRKK